MKTLALGTTLEVESDVPDTWLPVGNLTSIPVPGPTKSEVDTTDFDSLAAESLPGLPDYGEQSFSGFYNATDTGQALLFDDANDIDAPVRNFRIDFTRQDVRFTFAAYVKGFVPKAGGVNEAYTFDATLRMTGAVTRTTPIPA